MADMHRAKPTALTPYLDRLREIPFAREVELVTQPVTRGQRVLGADAGTGTDTGLRIRTPRRTFTFDLALKRTFLDRGLTNAVIADHLARQAQKRPMLLMARYIPRPTGERLAEAGVNFVDRVGNAHLTLGEDHHIFVLGRREPAPEPTARRPGPALVQLYFVLLVEPASAGWPVRRLADEAGIGKTAAAGALQRLERLGIIAKDPDQGYRVADRPRLGEAFLQGYVNVLRPHLEIGRFRGAEDDQAKFLHRFGEAAPQMHADWAATGAPGAYALDRFYRGGDTPIFVQPWTAAVQRTLRLLPDRNGPITLLRPFGQRWLWKTVAHVPVAHPWLIYAELLHGGEPRALEAAEHLRERFLAS